MTAATERELTLRAVLTGSLLGGLLSLCNIYSGLRSGWGFNMSITAALLGWGFWSVVAARAQRFGKLENNLNQTAASAGASISSAGLVSAIPAWTLMTGDTLTWGQLAAWTTTIGLLGVVVGIALRLQMIIIDRLPFASGIASAETLDKIHGGAGSEARDKLRALLGGLVAAALAKLAIYVRKLDQLKPPFSIDVGGGRSASFHNLTLSLDVSPLMIAVGALGSLRTGITMLFGSLVAWGVVAPWVIAKGWAEAGKADAAAVWFGPVVKWLLWPGVAMMVTASLTSVAFSWRSILRAFTGGKANQSEASSNDDPTVGEQVSKRALIVAFGLVAVAATAGQKLLFDIPVVMGLFATALTVALATVAGRVSGETTVTPVGAMGKVTQLVFGVLRPGDATANLMTANVTGGAASQTGDLLQDLKAGLLVGASPRAQAIAQASGVVAGGLCGSAAYLVLLPNPKQQLMTPEWPAPAVATWKAVAELFAKGLEAMPQGAPGAMLLGGALGILLAVLEKTLPTRAREWVPSPASLGLSFTLQAWTAISLFLGSVLALLLRRYAPKFAAGYITPIASGVIAGEGLMGVAIAVYTIAGGK